MKNIQKKPVITISRQFGSGGHSIAKRLSKELGIPFLDKEIVERAAEESGYTHEYIENEGEHLRKGKRLLDDFLLSNAPGYEDPQKELYRIQKEIILKAAEHPCIIVGRCADYILQEVGVDSFHVLIHASEKFRARRIEARYGRTEVPAMKRLQEKDRERNAYYRHFTKREWGVCQNYQLILDSGYLGEDTCVRLILTAIGGEKRAPEDLY